MCHPTGWCYHKIYSLLGPSNGMKFRWELQADEPKIKPVLTVSSYVSQRVPHFQTRGLALGLALIPYGHCEQYRSYVFNGQ
jgi:hypothetical protein